MAQGVAGRGAQGGRGARLLHAAWRAAAGGAHCRARWPAQVRAALRLRGEGGGRCRGSPACPLPHYQPAITHPPASFSPLQGLARRRPGPAADAGHGGRLGDGRAVRGGAARLGAQAGGGLPGPSGGCGVEEGGTAVGRFAELGAEGLDLLAAEAQGQQKRARPAPRQAADTTPTSSPPLSPIPTRPDSCPSSTRAAPASSPRGR